MERNPVGWFEIPVKDLDRAEAFYKSVLGYELTRQPENNGVTMSWFPMQNEVPGSPGTLVLGEGFTPSREGTMVYLLEQI